MTSILDLQALLSEPQKIMITTHFKPDGDALGSSLGLSLVLKSMGHEVLVISPSDFPNYLSWLPEADQIQIFPETEDFCTGFINESKLIFCLDFNHLKRINDLGRVVEKAPGLKIMVDHHLEPQGFEDLAFWDVEASSTCQLIFRLMDTLQLMGYMNKEVATCLYTGVMTDSGSFRFPRSGPELFRIAARLIESGADNVDIYERINGTQPLNRVQFLGYCINHKLVILEEFHTAYFYIDREELKRFDIETGETDGIVNYALGIESIKLAVFFIEREEKIKLSLRSKGNFPANEIATRYFSGGGHLNAAGGESDLNLENTIKKFRSILPEYHQLLVT
jgi:phosphoesterase RecJ-like protein